MLLKNLIVAAFMLGFAVSVFAKGKARQVVLVVCDGMRPDFVTAEHTPNLVQMASRGVWFRNHHAAFVSSTEVNAAVLATGVYPGNNGILGNEEYRPMIEELRSVNTVDWETVRRGDSLTSGHYLRFATLAELLHERNQTVIAAGAKSVALLANRAPQDSRVLNGVLFSGHTLPTNLLNRLTQKLGRFPVSNATNSLRNDWTTQALTEVLWQHEIPTFSLLWLNQPDYAQHDTGPGSPQTLSALHHLDQNVATLLHALDTSNAAQSTDVIVISDHGFSTISTRADLAKALKEIGVEATREFQTAPRPGEVMVVSNGGSVFVYVIGHDGDIVRKIVQFLQKWEYTGVIFTREPLPGTFGLNQIRANSDSAPDIIVSLRWSGDKNTNGTPGLVVSDSGYYPGQGTHGSLCPFDMRGMMIAVGPDFKSGVIDPVATGNIDVVPTILWLLGMQPPSHAEGRVVFEALKRNSAPAPPEETHRLEATCETQNLVWHQYLDLIRVGSVVYHDAGNGRQEKTRRVQKE